MHPRETLELYYHYANAGDWERWCDLFTADMVMDEQLVGHIEGRSTLREIMNGMNRTYSVFANHPRHIVVEGGDAAVVSHISASSTAGLLIEADVMNYFQLVDGKIAYMANFHDSVPFAPVLGR